MIEGLLRAHSARLQRCYDLLPSPARHLLTSGRGLFLPRNRYCSEAAAALREYKSHERWGDDQIAAYQLSCIREVTEHALATVPFYEHYPRVGWRTLEDLRQFPVLTRETVRANTDRLVSRSTPRRERIRVGTTGTTGANLKVVYTNETAWKIWALTLRQWGWSGAGPRQPRVTMFGSRVVPASRQRPPYWTYNFPEQQILLSVFHLSEQTAGDYIAFLRTKRGRILEGFPSVLGILADFILARGETVPMRVVFTSGEPLFPFLRARIEQAFQARAYDSYGMTELCGLVQECEQGQMHLIPECGYLEILDERGQPAPPSEEGYLVWTGLVNTAMPLIRYRIGDKGRWQAGGVCACGRRFSLVVPTITRDSDLLRCPDGRIFSPRALNQSLKNTSAFRFCQFVQEGPEKVVVRAVPSNGNASEELGRVRAELARILGENVMVSTVLATEPLVRAGGKIPLIVQQVR